MTATITTNHGVTCGKCSTFTVKVRHANVAAVRSCYMGTDVPVTAPEVVKMTSLPPVPVTLPTHPAPELSNRSTWGYVSDETPDPEKVVPAGRYGIKGTDGQFRFYVINHGQKGTKWEGRVFVSVQASDELHPVRNRDQRVGILAAIMTVGPLEASKAYGRELGICGVCRRTLTDPDSIANGIGPVCAGKL